MGVRVGVGGWRGRRGSHPKLRSIFKKKVDYGWGCASVWAAGAAAAAAAAAALDLTSVGGPLHFPQLDTAVEPDDGAEGERWQHAPIQAAVGKPASRVLLEQPGCFLKKGGRKKRGGRRKNLPVEDGPASLAPYGLTERSDWTMSSRVGRSLILFGSRWLQHILDRDYDRPVKKYKYILIYINDGAKQNK